LEKTILELFKYSRGTYYSWKKEKRPIIKLIEKYFTEDDLKEFIQTGLITKYEHKHNYGISLAIINNYISFIKNIIEYTKSEIEDGEDFKDTVLFTYFDLLKFINSFNYDELFSIIDDTQCRKIALKDLVNRYFKENPGKYSPFSFHYLTDFNLLTASYILEIQRFSFSEFYKYGVIYNYNYVYLHLIFELYYSNKIQNTEIESLFKQKNKKHIKQFLRENSLAQIL